MGYFYAILYILVGIIVTRIFSKGANGSNAGQDDSADAIDADSIDNDKLTLKDKFIYRRGFLGKPVMYGLFAVFAMISIPSLWALVNQHFWPVVIGYLAIGLSGSLLGKDVPWEHDSGRKMLLFAHSVLFIAIVVNLALYAIAPTYEFMGWKHKQKQAVSQTITNQSIPTAVTTKQNVEWNFVGGAEQAVTTSFKVRKGQTVVFQRLKGKEYTVQFPKAKPLTEKDADRIHLKSIASGKAQLKVPAGTQLCYTII